MPVDMPGTLCHIVFIREGNRQMTATINGKTYQAKETNGRFFYWSPKALRWLPVSSDKVAR
jgi:hypothetical protein